MVTNDETNLNLNYFKQIDMRDKNLSSFLSSINFYDQLCNICEILRSTPETEQLKILRKEIYKINKSFPANVYLPFTNNGIRNFVIAHIPVSELKIFRTKKRAPYMIILELFRLDEIM